MKNSPNSMCSTSTAVRRLSPACVAISSFAWLANAQKAREKSSVASSTVSGARLTRISGRADSAQQLTPVERLKILERVPLALDMLKRR